MHTIRVTCAREDHQLVSLLDSRLCSAPQFCCFSATSVLHSDDELKQSWRGAWTSIATSPCRRWSTTEPLREVRICFFLLPAPVFAPPVSRVFVLARDTRTQKRTFKRTASRVVRYGGADSDVDVEVLVLWTLLVPHTPVHLHLPSPS